MTTNSDQVLDRLLDLVIKTKAGMQIPPQNELAAQMGISRTLLREAVVKLDYLGVVSVRPKTGTTVNEPSKWRLVNYDVAAWRMRAGDTKEQVRADVKLAI